MLDARCQSFTGRRGPVGHLADFVIREVLREALLAARRGPVVHRATRRKYRCKTTKHKTTKHKTKPESYLLLHF